LAVKEIRNLRTDSPLRRRNRLPDWANVAIRIGFVFGLICTAILVHWFDRAGLRDSYDGEVSFLDVVYFTFISITTTGYGDIAPVTDRARLFDALLVTPIRIIVVFIFVGSAYNFVIKRSWEKWRMRRLQNNLNNHVVVCGFGTSGKEAVKELLARGEKPENIVVIDKDSDSLAIAEAMGCLVLNADATRDETLENVRIAKARAVTISAGSDDTSILVGLTVRHLAEHVPISMVVRAADNELLARQAGADQVINPVSFTGLLLAGSCHGQHITDYLTDLASVTGRVSLEERPVTEEEVGRSPRDLEDAVVVRIYRKGKPYGFWEEKARTLEAGDILVQIRPGLAGDRLAAED
jgi:voltage-gated potassium channel